MHCRANYISCNKVSLGFYSDYKLKYENGTSNEAEVFE